MTTQTSLVAISSLLSLLGICYLVFWRYRAFCMDFFKQSMFELRDSLFDYALSSNIGFDHPAYVVLRSTINGYLRFGHNFTALQAIVFVAFLSRDDKEYLNTRSFEKIWERAVKDLDSQAKTQMESFRQKMHSLAAVHILISSPLGLLLVVPLASILIPTLMIWKITRFLLNRGIDAAGLWITIRKRFDKTDNVALIFGDQATA